MKKMKRSLAVAALLTSVLATPSFAATFSNDWSFFDFQSNTTVSGTLSGLSNGSNLQATGLSATVTKAPYADMLGTFNMPSGYTGTYNSYSATNGVVNYANFFLTNSIGYLYFGTAPFSGTYYPEVYIPSSGHDAGSPSTVTSFAAATGAVPEPAAWAMMILGMGAIGAVMRRRVKVSEVNFTNHVRAIANS